MRISCKNIVKTLSNIQQDLHALIGKLFENNLAAIHEKKTSLTLNKPISVGFTVLETSKWEMYNFHYNFMIRKFNTRLLFTDTDSLCYEIHGKKTTKNNVQVQRTI